MINSGNLLINDYVKYYDEYSKKYNKLVVLMQVGSFFETYGIERQQEIYPNINIISDTLNIVLTKKSNLKDIQAYMCGFTASALKKYQNILLSHGYTCVIIEENGNGKKKSSLKKIRVITNIVSPGTNVDSENDFNNLVCLVINDDVYSISSIDVTLGTGLTFETTNIEDIYRFIKYQSPSEIVIYNIKEEMQKDVICNLLDIDSNIVQYYNNINENYFKVQYQSELLKKAGFGTDILSPIEHIGLERHPLSLISYILCIQFIYEHNENIIKDLKQPELWDSTLSLEKHLLLMNNSLDDLNIISNKTIRTRNSSIYDLFNECSTVLGRRYLRQRLLKPYNDNNIKLIQQSYNNIEEMQNKDYCSIKTKLKGVYDLQRFHRKLKLNTITFSEFKKLYTSYLKVSIVRDNTEFSWINKPNIQNIINYIENIFDFSSTEVLPICIKSGINKKVDYLNNQINLILDEFNNIVNELSDYIGVEGSVKLNEPINYIKSYGKGSSSAVANEEYYLLTTNIRAKVLKEKIKDKMHSFTFKQTGSGTRIVNDYITDNNSKILGYYQELINVSKIIFKDVCKDIINCELEHPFQDIEEYVSTIDFYSTIAKVSIDNGYHKPIISAQASTSFVNAKDVRHPLIERINNQVEFITNDITLDDSQTGNLIFSVNYGGKSTLLRSLGINIILAQAGMYVAAKEFNYYPFKMLIARINSSDNIFKSQSLFTSQMTEIRPIIKNSNLGSSVLVLTDELCNSTETVSAISLLAAIIVNLVNNNVRFMFSTHYHDITKLSEIKELKTLKYYHFRINCDNKGKITYERKLKPGVGETLYGIEIAKSLDLGASFINHALKIRKEMTGQSKEFMSTKKSKYNSKKYVDTCNSCGSNSDLHTHHINEQNEADLNGIIDGKFHKNTLHNLMTLCKKCHEEHHN